MKNKIQVLLSVMNIKDENEYLDLLNKNKISGSVVAVNQTKKNIFCIENGKQQIYSYSEKRASKSRNRLLEKAKGDICIFADNDTKYVDGYEEIIEKEYQKRPEADGIIFYIENTNKQREQIKKIGNKKVNLIDVMKIRTSEITLKRETIEKIQKMNIKFDTNFGPNGIFLKGEETIFISELIKKGLKIYGVNKKIGTVEDKKSTWFTGFNEKYLYDQGAIFYRISSKFYKLLNLQYVIRKHNLYKKHINIFEAYKQMINGARDCKNIYMTKEGENTH